MPALHQNCQHSTRTASTPPELPANTCRLHRALQHQRRSPRRPMLPALHCCQPNSNSSRAMSQKASSVHHAKHPPPARRSQHIAASGNGQLQTGRDACKQHMLCCAATGKQGMHTGMQARKMSKMHTPRCISCSNNPPQHARVHICDPPSTCNDI
jgi:hypothetical protein